MSSQSPAPISRNPTPEKRVILFFDGVCGLCNFFVDWVMSRDKSGLVRFAPLQGRTATNRLPENFRNGTDDTVVLDDGSGRFLIRSAAVFATLSRLPNWRLFAAIASRLPEPLVDMGYRFVAKNRHRWFGRRDTCRMPTPEERSRFLD